uniref:Uncharacterized protein n=1 Tax=Physcomitrium patens TaxID=3218 RepID=A0A7I4E6X2_PHYPA
MITCVRGILFILGDGMFSGSYHGKKCPPPDLVHVLQRAWDAGLIRIIVTGGSLKESKEALSLTDIDDICKGASNEFEESGDSEKHLQDLLQLTIDGVARGKSFDWEKAPQWQSYSGSLSINYFLCVTRFIAGVVHSFTGTS